MIWYVSHKTLSQQQQEAIRWYNNWPPAPPKKPAHPPPFYINCFRFTLRTPPPSPPSGRWAQIETTKQTNFDIMSFTMKSKSLFLCLSIPLYPFYLGYLFELNWIVCQSLFLRCPPEPNRTRWYPYFSSLFCFFVAPLSPLRSAPPRPSHIVQFDSRTRGIQSIFTTKKNLLQLLLLQITIVLGHGCWESWWRWPTTAHTAPSRYLPLPAGRYPSNWSSPNLLTTTITLLLFSLTAFQYFGIFSDRKNIPAPVEASPPSPRFSLGLSRDGASEAGRIGINGH